MAATLARAGINPQTGRRVTNAKVVQRTLSVMVTCGMYNGAGDWVSAVGMPAKSGLAAGSSQCYLATRHRRLFTAG